MDVTHFDDARAFLAAAEPLLLEHEARHNLALGLVGILSDRPEACPGRRLWLVAERGRTVGVALMTPPARLVIATPAAEGGLEALVAALVTEGVDLPGVVGGVPEADDLAALYTGATGRPVSRREAQGIYALTEVAPVPPASGRPRPAEHRDRERILPWLRAFHEQFEPGHAWDEEAVRVRVDRRMAGGRDEGLRVWDDGAPVSLAGFGSATRNGLRIGPVYTPPEARGRGYATALVAALSAEVLRWGRRFCFLYTDLSDPTSNAIYRRMGYRLVCESAQLDFAPR